MVYDRLVATEDPAPSHSAIMLFAGKIGEVTSLPSVSSLLNIKQKQGKSLSFAIKKHFVFKPVWDKGSVATLLC